MWQRINLRYILGEAIRIEVVPEIVTVRVPGHKYLQATVLINCGLDCAVCIAAGLAQDDRAFSKDAVFCENVEATEIKGLKGKKIFCGDVNPHLAGAPRIE